MEISQCNYCGMTCFTDAGACSACRDALGITPEPAEAAPAIETNAHFSSVESFPQTFENNTFAPAATDEFAASAPPRREAGWKKCPVCGAGIAQYRDVCMRCKTVKPVKKKSAAGKIMIIFVLFLLAGGGFYYLYEDNSPAGILKKYGKATGTNGNLVFESFVMKGDATITVSAVRSSSSTAYLDGGNFVSGGNQVLASENYSFDMFFKNPNKSFLDFYKPTGANSPEHVSAYKQGFNGTAGWKYTNMFNQPATLEDTGDAFGIRRMGMGLDEFGSVQALNDATRAEYGEEAIKSFDSVKNIDVNGVPTVSEKKTYVVARRTKTDGKTDESILIFDEKTGFLIGVLKKEYVNATPVITRIFVDGYKKFPVKENGFFGVRNKLVLVPTAWKFKMGQQPSYGGINQQPNISVTIELKINNLSTDVPVDDALFEKPAAK